MAEEAAPELIGENPPTEDMDLETGDPTAPTLDPDADGDPIRANDDPNSKRGREEGEEEGAVSKKQKAEKSFEEERLEKSPVEPGPVKLGPKEFGSSVEMFDYFFKFLHYWSPNINVNKYEHMVLLDLIKTGHSEPDKKIGGGIQAFQVRYHPTWKSRCFFLIREDESVDDFSFRKCVDHIIPLPEDMKVKSNVNRGGGGGGKGRGGKAGRRGHGRGGKSWK